MPRVLMSFLGRTRDRTGKRSYHEMRYDFGEEIRVSRYFSAVLLEHLRVTHRAPDRLLLLGTPGSMWDDVLDVLGGGDAALAPAIEAAVGADRVDQALADRIAPVLSDRLGVAVDPVVIPYANTDAEVLALVPLIARHVPSESRLVVDLTHGLRHLPMIGLVASLALETLADVRVEGIYYGARDLAQGDVAPVMRLDGLISLLRWLDALRLYDVTGRLGPLGAAIERETGIKVAKRLRQADFLEQAGQLGGAGSAVDEVMDLLEEAEGPIFDLLAPNLSQRLSWISGATLSARQRRLAEQALDNDDYLRAAVLTFEAMVSAEIEADGGDPKDSRAREALQKYLADSLWDRRPPKLRSGLTPQSYARMKAIRNAVAHATTPRDPQAIAALKSEMALTEAIRRALLQLKA